MMNRHSRVMLIAVLVVLGLFGACGSRFEGNYSNPAGNVVLELHSGGKADFTVMGEMPSCTWKADSSKVVLTCRGDSVNFVRYDDGSLFGPGFIQGRKKDVHNKG
jgi:hypothetical protein